MKNWIKSIPIRFEIFLPILGIVLISIFLLTWLIIHKAKDNIRNSVQDNLRLEVNSIVKMFERENALKMENAINDLKVANYLFYAKKLEVTTNKKHISALNQFTDKYSNLTINEWILDKKPVYQNNELVDLIGKLTGSTATIFQKCDSGFIRVSTNVLLEDSTRAVNTYLPFWSPVVQEVMKRKTYIGRAYVVNDWYITAYQPIYLQNEIAGMLYVGKKEKDLPELKKILQKTKIGITGYPFVFDESGNIIIHTSAENENWSDKPFIKKMIKQKSGVFAFWTDTYHEEKIIAYTYFPEFRFYVAALADIKTEMKPLVNKILFFSILTSVFVVIIITILIYSITKKRIYKYLLRLEDTDKALITAKHALQQSEKQFRTLFNNTSDDIFVVDFEGKFIEFNNSACINLGYSREELMKKRFSDIKTPAYVNTVRSNIEIIKTRGSYQYESEHVTKDGQIFPVEMKSKKIMFNGREVILTSARDISERKKVEQKIISTIIETEEKERKRFAADLHDVLAPILTTIKLFTDLLKKGDQKKITDEEIIANIDELINQAIVTTKEISNNIRPNVLQDFGLATAIRDFCTYINKTRSVKINLVTTNYTVTKRGIEETILYQATKELINNTLKHAQATNITIDLKSYKNQIILYYRDNGIGFVPDKILKEKSGLGLSNVFNKIKTIKGTIDLNSSPGNGMFMLISIKITEND